MKTVEILLVIVTTTIFLMVIIPQNNPALENKIPAYLINIEPVPEFRDFVMKNSGCYDPNTALNLISDYLPHGYDYLLCINSIPTNLPNKKVYVDSIYFAGNITSLSSKVIRLYFWSIR